MGAGMVDRPGMPEEPGSAGSATQAGQADAIVHEDQTATAALAGGAMLAHTLQARPTQQQSFGFDRASGQLSLLNSRHAGASQGKRRIDW